MGGRFLHSMPGFPLCRGLPMRDGSARNRARTTGSKKIRCDLEPADSSPTAATGPKARLLDVFRRWLDPAPQELRRAARHAARTFVVWVGWWQGANNREFFALTARLANISRGGVLLYVAQPPPQKHAVWLCLGTPEPDECLAARVLEVRRT